MPNLGSSPYYGGGQVPNPSNVTQIYADPPEFKASLGSLAVNSTAETAYMAIAESGSNGRTVWAELFTGASSDVFPITPFVVGPEGKAGYQTIQSALDAANTNPGSVVYIQPGTYTENLTWPQGVSLVCTEPTSFFETVNIIGQHTIVAGLSTSVAMGVSHINFSANGTLFFSALASTINFYIQDCFVSITGEGYVFSFPGVTTFDSSLQIIDTTVVTGATLLTSAIFDLYVENSVLNGGSGPTLTNNGGFWGFLNSSFFEPISIAGGSATSGNLVATNSSFKSSVVVSGSLASSCTLTRCDITSGASSCLTVEGNSSANVTSCQLSSTNPYAIAGTTTGTVVLADLVFLLGSSIEATLAASITLAARNLMGGLGIGDSQIVAPANGLAVAAQVSVGGSSPSRSALMHLFSTTQGFVPPSMTTVEKDAISAPIAGLVVYDTTLNQLSYYNSASWTNL